MFWQKKRHKSLLETVSLTSTTWKTVKKINIKHKSSDLLFLTMRVYIAVVLLPNHSSKMKTICSKVQPDFCSVASLSSSKGFFV